MHDHLYSPAALVSSTGVVIERYEYDAYGNPTIWNADFTTERDNSNYGNPYLFTGRRVDILDSGSLKIQYNRNRYYDYYSGRWLTQDPVGYIDGMNLYEYVQSNPVINNDPMGLSVGSIVKQIAITRLKKLDDKHAGYDYYTELTGLKPLLFDKLVPALEWLDDNDYFWVTTPVSYLAEYTPRGNFKMTPGAERETMFHEAIHVYNDKVTRRMSLRKDEGIAWAASRMERRFFWFQDIEKKLSEDIPNVGELESRWQSMWFSINVIVGYSVARPIVFQIETGDVTNVATYLDFEFSCEKIAKHYSSILKTKSNWKKERCPRFTCTTIPLVNVKSLHLNQELLSVFE